MDKQSFIEEISKVNPSTTFLSVIGYRNNFDEISNFSILFHVKYETILKKSLEIISGYKTFNMIERDVKMELIESFEESLEKLKDQNVDEIVDDCYLRFKYNDQYIKGLKMHKQTNELYIYGLLVFKKILVPGNYKEVKSKEKTIIKNKLKDLCPISKFRQFRISPEKVEYISVQKKSILPPSNDL